MPTTPRPSPEGTSITTYWQSYSAGIAHGLAAIKPADLDRAFQLLEATITGDRWVYSCGNGGSAAISNHLQCDFAKGMRKGTSLLPRVISLSANLETVTAIGNDIDYAEVFSYQLENLARAGDLLLTISSSGNSENVVRAIDRAKTIGMPTISFTGFEGGRTATNADVNLHIPVADYGVVEDCHQSIMHMFAQYLRAKHTPG